ncbi:MAG: extracellular solute-binding protein [Chloroflexi bacterium]|nr:extracellular solute-binding protein [Chloroflexota bacterium]
MKNIVRLIFVIALVAVVLTACAPAPTAVPPTAAPKPTEAPKPTTVPPTTAPPTAVPPTAAPKPTEVVLEKELVLYSAADQAMVDFAAQAFQAKTGIKVSTVQGGSGVMLARINAEKARPLGDVLWSVGPDTIGAMPDLFEPYKLKEFDKLLPEAQDKTNLIAPCTGIASATIMYNKKLVPAADVPKKWADLLDPKWKGKIVNADPSKSSSSYQSLVTRLIAFKDKGWEFEEKLIQNLVIVPSSSAVYLQVGTGEQALGLAFEQGAYIYAAGATATAGVVYPTDGTGVLFDVAALIKGAQHPNAAKAFLDFSVSAEFQKALIEKYYGRRAVRSDVTLPPGVPLAKDIKTTEYDLKWAADNRDANLKKYQELMVKYNK